MVIIFQPVHMKFQVGSTPLLQTSLAAQVSEVMKEFLHVFTGDQEVEATGLGVDVGVCEPERDRVFSSVIIEPPGAAREPSPTTNIALTAAEAPLPNVPLNFPHRGGFGPHRL